MTATEKTNIRKMIATLQGIDNGEKVFFNIALYERLGLVIRKKKWATNAAGAKIEMGNSFHLTDKSRKYLNVII